MKKIKTLSNLNKSIKDNIKLKSSFRKQIKTISKVIDKISEVLKNGNKILICGNGGSAADAQHLTAEFLIRLNSHVKRKPFPVINLVQDTSTLTACGNDIGFNEIFRRNLQAFAKPDDVLYSISTSGNSKNIINVLKEAKKMDIFSISLLGNNGGECKAYSNLNILLPTKNTARIQENQIFISHFIFNEVEKKLIK
tara:strand:+ start:1543 stop:2130 length:588 start_codon:yes stop_codon:yes gene_type:complete